MIIYTSYTVESIVTKWINPGMSICHWREDQYIGLTAGRVVGLDLGLDACQSFQCTLTFYVDMCFADSNSCVVYCYVKLNFQKALICNQYNCLVHRLHHSDKLPYPTSITQVKSDYCTCIPMAGHFVHYCRYFSIDTSKNTEHRCISHVYLTQLYIKNWFLKKNTN